MNITHRTKIFTSIKVWSSSLKKFVYIYSNSTTGTTFQQGTIGEKILKYFKPEINSVECGPKSVYYSAEKSIVVYKNNCSSGNPVPITYVVPYGKYSSSISQFDANNQADADINANAQNFANEFGQCSTIYYSAEKSGTATKNNCSTGSGSTVTYIVPAGTYNSSISQADADQQAQNDVNNNKQAFANNHGVCSSVFYNTEKSTTIQKNDCSSSYIGSIETYVVPAGTYSSNVSQEDADNQALNDINTNKQAYANSVGTCIVSEAFLNVEKSGTAYKSDCGSGYTGSNVIYVVPAGSYSSLVSQAAADAMAQNDIDSNKQAYADAHGTCTPNCNLSISVVFQRVSGVIRAIVTVTGGSGNFNYYYTHLDLSTSNNIVDGIFANEVFEVTVADLNTGCVIGYSGVPIMSKILGIKMELMYFQSATTDSSDPYYPRLGTGSHICNKARYEMFANSYSLGIFNVNNANGVTFPDIDQQNRPPEYPNYSNSNSYDRYTQRILNGGDISGLATSNGVINISLVYTGTDVPHSQACWLRIKKDSSVLLSTTLSSFSGFTFDPFA